MRKSDPGYPLRSFAATNDIALSLYLDKIVDVALNRMLALGRCETLPTRASELVSLGLCDLIRVFPKNEPHKESKLIEGRIRLISSISLVDNIVDRCTFGLQNAHEIEKWKTIPSKPGMGFTPESVASVISQVDGFSKAVSLDAKGWDWSVQGWEFDMEAEARISLMEGITPFLSNLIRSRLYCMSLGVFVLPNGTLYGQVYRGIMKSGLYVTSSSNSRIGFMDYSLIGGDPSKIIIQGDDAVEDFVVDYAEKYYALGHNVTLTEVTTGFEFCSQHYLEGSRYSLNAAKLVFNLLHKVGNPLEDRIARFEVFRNDLGAHPNIPYLMELLRVGGYFKDFPRVLEQQANTAKDVPPCILGEKGWYPCLKDIQSSWENWNNPENMARKNKQAKAMVIYDPSSVKAGPPRGQLQPPTKGGVPQQQKKAKSRKAKTPQKTKTVPRYVLSQVDPFNERSFGVKVPDSNTADSSTAFSRNDYSLSTPASGGAGVIFRSSPHAYLVGPTTATQTAWTWPAAFANSVPVSNLTNLQAAFAAVRTVSFGIQISTRMSYTAAAGIVHVALLPDMVNLTTWDYPATTSILGYAPFHVKIPMTEIVENGYTVTSRFTDATAHKYMDTGSTDIGTYNASNPTPGWNAIMVWVEGAPASSVVLDIEYIAHYECLSPSTSTAGIIASSPAVPHSPAVMSAVSYLNDMVPPAQPTKLNGDVKHVDWAQIWDAGLAIANGVGQAAEMALDFIPLFL